MPKPAEIKTKQNAASVDDFINSIEDETKRNDCLEVIRLMKAATDEEPMMWGASMIGFGKLRYKSPSGREVDWFKIGFAPRKSNLSIHLTTSIKKQAASLEKLGKHKLGEGCLYINKLADVDLSVLKEMIQTAAKAERSTVNPE